MVDEARAVWAMYSAQWQGYNVIRMAVSGIVLVLASVALFFLKGATRPADRALIAAK